MTTLSIAALLLAAAPAAMGRLDPKAFCEDKAYGSYADVSSHCTKYVVCAQTGAFLMRLPRRAGVQRRWQLTATGGRT